MKNKMYSNCISISSQEYNTETNTVFTVPKKKIKLVRFLLLA